LFDLRASNRSLNLANASNSQAGKRLQIGPLGMADDVGCSDKR